MFRIAAAWFTLVVRMLKPGRGWCGVGTLPYREVWRGRSARATSLISERNTTYLFPRSVDRRPAPTVYREKDASDQGSREDTA